MTRTYIASTMITESALRSLYRSFDALRNNERAAGEISRLLSIYGDRLHPSSGDKRTFRAFEATFKVDLGDRYGRMCYYGAIPEKSELNLFLSLCGRDSQVWDIGANFGLYATLAGTRAAECGQVFAIEPNERARAMLRCNRDENQLTERITILDCAVSDQNATASFVETTDSAFSSLVNTRRSKVDRRSMVNTRTLDSLWKELGSRPIDLLKIDVEGFEGKVLNGGKCAIEASPNIIVMFEHSPKNLSTVREKELLRILDEVIAAGFEMWAIESSGSLSNIPANHLASGLTDINGNVFMVRAGSKSEENLLGAADDLSSAGTPHDEDLATDLRETIEIMTETLGAERDHQRRQHAEALAKRNTQIEQLKNQIEAQDAVKSDIREALKQTRDRLEEMRSSLIARDQKSEGLRKALENSEARVAALRQAINTRETKLIGLRDALEKTQTLVSGLTHVIEERNTTVNELSTSLAASQDLASELRQSIAGRNAEVAELNNSLASIRDRIKNRDDEISSLQEALTDSRQLVDSLRETVATRENRIIGLQDALHRSQSVAAELQDAIAKQAHKLDALKLAVRQSSSHPPTDTTDTNQS